YVGKTETGEWLQYTVNAKSAKGFTADIRYAGLTAGSLSIEDAAGIQLAAVSLPSTGGNEIWKTVSAKGINLRKGENKIRIIFKSNGINLQSLELK
uniref:carbohydrate-binding domain-containing protein n=1 Tax=uncultured Chryseobacterium sp. TaxID=259322 RepID=UPI0025D68083